MKRPNFFIIGAPKCGTTSLVNWLRQSPQAFLSTPKEPWFFSPDIVPSAYETIDQYEQLFREADERHVAVGEGSVFYLRSRVAVPRIVEYQPLARFIVMLRSPLEMAVSLHAQTLYNLDESIRSFDEAWAAQDDRRKGQRIPRRCRSPQFLQYGYLCKIGEQLEQLYATVDHEKVHVVYLEDMKLAPESTYRNVASFLGMDPEPLPDFVRANQRKTLRLRILHRLLKGVQEFKQRSGLGFQTGLLAGLHTWNDKPLAKLEISDTTRVGLTDYFREDVEKLADLTHRDLSHWLERGNA